MPYKNLEKYGLILTYSWEPVDPGDLEIMKLKLDLLESPLGRKLLKNL